MKTYIINPVVRACSVANVELEGLLDFVKDRVGDEPVSQVTGPGVVLWVDARGLLRPEPALWSFRDVPEAPFAGVGILHGCDAMGQLGDPPFMFEELMEQIKWRDDIRFDGLDERMILASSPNGFLPSISRAPRWVSAQPEPAPLPKQIPQNGSTVLVFREGEHSFRAVRLQGSTPVGEWIGASTEELYDEMDFDPERAVKDPPGEGYKGNLVEVWHE